MFYSFSSSVQFFNPFWVTFCIWFKVRVRLHSFACRYTVFPAPFVKKTVLPPFNVLSTLVKNHFSINARIYFWVIYSIPLVYIAIFMSVPHGFDHCSSVIGFEIRKCTYSPSFFFFNTVLAIQSPLRFHHYSFQWQNSQTTF